MRYAIRSLLRAPGYSLLVILTLALGIGANTAVFSVVRGVLLRPLPHANGDRLVYMKQSAERAGLPDVKFSVPEIVDLRGASPALSGIAEYSAMPFTMLGGDRPVQVVESGTGTVLGTVDGARAVDVRMDGDRVAAVVFERSGDQILVRPMKGTAARGRHLAEDALELIEVEYEPLDAVVDAYAAIQPGAPALHANAPDNVAARAVYVRLWKLTLPWGWWVVL